MGYKGYANPELLVTPEEVMTRLAHPGLCLVDSRTTYEYATGHIPGAVHLDLYGISLNNTGLEVLEAFLWSLSHLLGDRGIGSDSRIVFYENDSGVRAARGFWICECLGHKNVQVLDGGFEEWTSAGYPVETAYPEVETKKFESREGLDRHIGVEEIKGLLGCKDFVALDVRSNDEYYARNVRSKRGGAIPGAVHIEYVHNLDEKGAFKPADELREIFERAGVMPEQTIACY